MLKIGLGPSRLLAVILVFAHFAAIAIIISVAIPGWIQLIATAVIVVHLPIVVGRRALLLAPDAAVAIEIGSGHGICVQTRAGEWSECQVLGSTYVTPFLTVLDLREADNAVRKRITLLPDSLEAGDFRQLRVWLRWHKDRALP